jgi:hypothetical protein
MLRQSILCLVAAGMVAGCGQRQKAGESSKEATLLDMNRALATVTMRAGRCPSDVNVLTNCYPVQGKRLPTPPTGKNLVIDRVHRQVVFVDAPPGN